MFRRRRLATAFVLFVALTGLAWRYQSTLIGLAARWYLGRVAAREDGAGTLDRRRAVVLGMHRLLLLGPPPDAMVAELFDLATLLSERTASGGIPIDWAAYIYTGYARDLLRDRPDGTPRRPLAAMRAALDDEVAFYSIRQRPEATGVRVRDLWGPGDGYTADEIDQAAREGRELPLR